MPHDRPLDDHAVSDLEAIAVDQPADAVQHRGFRFVDRGVAELRARLLDRGELATREVLPAGVGELRRGAGPELGPAHRAGSGDSPEPARGDCQEAADRHRRRRHHVERLPPAASRCSIASWNACATSSAWTWCRSSAPRPGTTISSPAERAYQTFGSRFPSGPMGGQPGPLMWPGWRTVVTRPPDRVSAASSSAIAAFWVPYSPNGGEVSSSHIGCLTLAPYLQMVPQWIRCSQLPRSGSTSAFAESGVKQIMSTTTSASSAATRRPNVPVASSATRSTKIC